MRLNSINFSGIFMTIFFYFPNVEFLLNITKQKEITSVTSKWHRFEFTFELAWKTMKDFLEYNGISENIGSPREILRRAFESHLIEDGEEWIDMMLARNSLSHLYDEETSRKIYKEIKEKYIKLLEKLNNKFETLI